MNIHTFFFFLRIRRPPRSPLCPYTPLFRSLRREHQRPIGLLPVLDPVVERLSRRRPASVRHQDVDRSKSDRKSTRLNSSHANISYAVFCLKKKKITSSPCLCTLLFSLKPSY